MKIGNMPSGEKFFSPGEASLTQEYFVYSKENWQSMAEKESLLPFTLFARSSGNLTDHRLKPKIDHDIISAANRNLQGGFENER